MTNEEAILCNFVNISTWLFTTGIQFFGTEGEGKAEDAFSFVCPSIASARYMDAWEL